MNFHLPTTIPGPVSFEVKRGGEEVMPPSKPRVIALIGIKGLYYTEPKKGTIKCGPHGVFDRDLHIVGEWGAVYGLDDGTSEISPGGHHFIVRSESGLETKIPASKVRFN